MKYAAAVLTLCLLMAGDAGMAQNSQSLFPQTSPFGDTIRAKSQARILDEIAKQQALVTRKKKVETYWYVKRFGQRERAKDNAKKRAARDEYLANRGSGAPEKLSSRQLDRFSGRINWPTTFEAPIYESDCKALDALFEERAESGNRRGLAQEIATACNTLEIKLQKNIKTMPSSEYLAAKKFLRSLKDEHRGL